MDKKTTKNVQILEKKPAHSPVLYAWGQPSCGLHVTGPVKNCLLEQGVKCSRSNESQFQTLKCFIKGLSIITNKTPHIINLNEGDCCHEIRTPSINAQCWSVSINTDQNCVIDSNTDQYR